MFPPPKFEARTQQAPTRADSVTFGGTSATHMNTIWDVVDLVAIVLDVCVMETRDSGHDWRLKLHIPLQVGEDA
eukprot:12930527-Prorocentrum_lima.AAC.1